MVPPVSDRIPPVPPYSGLRYAAFRCRVRSFHALRPAFPDMFPYLLTCNVAVLQPRTGLDPHGLGSSAFARRYLRNHCCFLFLRVLRCFSSPRSPHVVVMRRQRIGFPHSEIRGSRAICASPRLIAACHVLRRLREPRHPPCALT